MVSKLLLPFNAAMQREGAGSRLTSKLKEMVVIKTVTLMRAITDLRITRRLVKRQEFLKSRRSKLVLGIISPLIYSLTEKKWRSYGLNMSH